MYINEDERIDDLQVENLKIIQNKNEFCFGIDSVLLVNFINNIKETDKIVDLGTGNGILGILLAGKKKSTNIIGIEVQKNISDMAKKSIELNGLEEKFIIINEDIKNIVSKNIIKKNTIDIVITNPPYKNKIDGIINENISKNISRHETTATLADFVEVSAQLLKDKGVLYMVHKAERLVDIIYEFRKNKIEPKEIQVVFPSEDKNGNLILVKGVKGGKKFLKIHKPLYILDNNGQYSKDIKNI